MIPLRRLLPLLLLCTALLLSACAGTQTTEGYSLTLWYVEGDPLAPAITRLAEDYNRSRGRATLPVTLRAWSSEEQLRATLQRSTVPALVLCPHTLALQLEEFGLLREPGTPSPSYPDWLTQRADCVGHGFYPVGFSLPLLCTREGAPTSLPALLSYAAGQGQTSGLPALYVGRFAPLFYQTLLDRGTEFTADPVKDSASKDYVNLYNALMACRFAHGLAYGPAVDTACYLDDSAALAARTLESFRVTPLSEGPLLAEGRGLAVTARDTRMQRALPDFLRYLIEAGRLSRAALEAGLIPAWEEELSPSGPLETVLLQLRGRTLHLPDPESKYYVNQLSFEQSFLDALELLH